MTREELVAEVEDLRERLGEAFESATELKRVEQALRESEARYRSFIEHSTEGIYRIEIVPPVPVDLPRADVVAWIDEHAVVAEVNEALAAMYGLRVEDMVGHLATEFAPGYGARAALVLERPDLHITEEETRDVDAAGNTVFLVESFHGEVVDGRLSRVWGVQRSITEKKKEEDARRETERRLAALVDFFPDATLAIDEKKRVIIWNRAMEKMSGIPASEMLGKGDHAYTVPFYGVARPQLMDLFWEPRHEVLARYPILREEGDGLVIEVECPALYGGKGAFVWAKASPLRDSAGRLIGAIECIRDISDRKRSEHALRDSQTTLQGIVSSVYAAIFTIDSTGAITYVNDHMTVLFGRGADELVGSHYFDLVHQSQWSEARSNLRRILAGEIDHVTIERLFVRGDGTPFWGQLSGRRLKAPDGTCPNIIGVIVDLTEQKRAEEALRDTEERLAEILDFLPDATFAVDLEGIVILWNRAMEEMTGVPARDTLSRGDHEYSLPFYGARRPMLIDAALWHDPATEGRYRSVRREGDVVVGETDATVRGKNVVLWARARPLYDARGKIIGAIESIRDITEGKRTEQALREGEARYRTLVESAGYGIVLLDPVQRVLSANSRAREWFPELESHLGERCFEFWRECEGHNACADCPIAQAVADGRTHERLRVCPTSRGERAMRFLATPIVREDGVVGSVICTIEDVTDRIKLEQEASRAEKLESLGVLAGGIAHDFNNILVAILGNISLARMDLEPESELEVLLGEAESAAERAKDLTRQLLTFSKGGAPVKQTTSLEEIVRETAGFCLRGSNSRCEFSFDADLASAEVDPGQFSQVVNNLVLNAAQAMPRGGTIRVAAGNRTVREGDALPLVPGEYVMVEIRDEGVGIPRELLQRIFDPFFTTKERGSGLGLASSYSIVKRHGGHIEVQTEPQVGTTFRVYVPASSEKRPRPARPEAEVPGGTGRILVVDDEAGVRSLAGATLVKLGYEVVAVESGTEALRVYIQARERGTPFDALILDLTIPGDLGGREVVARLREVDPDVKAIVSSGYSTDPIMADHERYGFSECVAKPYRVSELAQVLRRVLTGQK